MKKFLCFLVGHDIGYRKLQAYHDGYYCARCDTLVKPITFL